MARAADDGIRKPARLRPGDTVGIVAPSSAWEGRSELLRGIAGLEAWDLRVKLGDHVNDRHGYMAGRDEDRAADIHAMLADDEVRAIVCLQGGYGTPRLIPLLDEAAFAENPKILCGYSDITTLHLAQSRWGDVISFYSNGVAGIGDVYRAGVDLDVVDEDYLAYRIASTRYLGEGLVKHGFPIVQPPGGHAIYIDAGAFLPHVPPSSFPGQALACAFYEQGGIRGVEVGTLMFGGKSPETGGERTARLELLRLAIPRRVYTQSHVDYVIEVAGELAARRDSIRGFSILEEPPQLRHFSATLQPL